MLKPVVPGKPAVNRFKAGKIYLLQQSKNNDYYFVGVFMKKTKMWLKAPGKYSDLYSFRLLADNRIGGLAVGHCSVSVIKVPVDKINNYQVCELVQKDLPLYINSKRTTPEFNRILSGKPRKRSGKKSKIQTPIKI